MVVFALILLFFANHNAPSILFDTAGTEAATGGSYLPAFALGMFMALFVVYGFDTAGTFGEETIDAGRQAPRGVLWSVAISGIVGHDLPARGDPRDPGRPGRDDARSSRSPTRSPRRSPTTSAGPASPSARSTSS